MKKEWKRSHLAEKLGISKAGIKKAIDAGSLVLNRKGNIDDSNPKNIPYIVKKCPDFYEEDDAHPNSKVNKQNGFKAGGGQNTAKKKQPARLKKSAERNETETIITDTGTELVYDPQDIDDVLQVERIKKLKKEQERIDLQNQKVRGELIETRVVLHILNTFIPEYKKRVLKETERLLLDVCVTHEIIGDERSEYTLKLNRLIESASDETNESVLAEIEKVFGEIKEEDAE